LGGLGGVRDLVVVALPGVQDFIAEAQSTSDVYASSVIFAALADRVVGVLRDAGGELVLPAAQLQAPETTLPAGSSPAGTPNRAVALFPSGAGLRAAGLAAAGAQAAWRGWVGRALGVPAGEVPATPGFPVVQWVCLPLGSDDYELRWGQARRVLAARRRVRDFGAVPDLGWRQRELCPLAPRWPAEPKAPAGVPAHESKALLSAAGWVKRRWSYLHGADGFPSTASIASAPYRLALLRQLGDADVAAAVRVLDEAHQVVRSVLGPGTGRHQSRARGGDPGFGSRYVVRRSVGVSRSVE